MIREHPDTLQASTTCIRLPFLIVKRINLLLNWWRVIHQVRYRMRFRTWIFVTMYKWRRLAWPSQILQSHACLKKMQRLDDKINRSSNLSSSYFREQSLATSTGRVMIQLKDLQPTQWFPIQIRPQWTLDGPLQSSTLIQPLYRDPVWS